MVLKLPGSSSSTLALTAPSGAQVMDPQFHALLCANKVRPEDITKLGTAGIDSAKMFGHIAKSDEKFALFIKRICNIDPETRGEDAPPLGEALHGMGGMQEAS